MQKYSNIICFGDSYTNEETVYESLGYLDIFKERGYEFKSYPKVLSEYYNAPYETFGAGGMPIHFVIGELIKKMDYILSLENPLVIFQFGFFCNAILKYDNDTELMWKDLAPTNIGDNSFIAVNKRDVINSLNFEDKLSIVNWFEKFEDKRNYYYIDTFISLCKFLNTQKKIDIFGFLLTHAEFNVPNNKFILKLSERGWPSNIERINDVFKDLTDTHKSTKGNTDLAMNIIDKIKTKKYKL
jgi:hypothetical protein